MPNTIGRRRIALAILAFGLCAMTPAAAQTRPAANPAMSEWRRDVDLRINRSARYLGKLSVRGETLIALRIDRGGRLVESKVLRSSGNTELDGAFLAVVRTAAPFPPLPSAYAPPSMAFTTVMSSGPRKGDFHGMKPLRPYRTDF
jgi:protein TonB